MDRVVVERDKVCMIRFIARLSHVKPIPDPTKHHLIAVSAYFALSPGKSVSRRGAISELRFWQVRDLVNGDPN